MIKLTMPYFRLFYVYLIKIRLYRSLTSVYCLKIRLSKLGLHNYYSANSSHRYIVLVLWYKSVSKKGHLCEKRARVLKGNFVFSVLIADQVGITQL